MTLSCTFLFFKMIKFDLSIFGSHVLTNNIFPICNISVQQIPSILYYFLTILRASLSIRSTVIWNFSALLCFLVRCSIISLSSVLLDLIRAYRKIASFCFFFPSFCRPFWSISYVILTMSTSSSFILFYTFLFHNRLKQLPISLSLSLIYFILHFVLDLVSI